MKDIVILAVGFIMIGAGISVVYGGWNNMLSFVTTNEKAEKSSDPMIRVQRIGNGVEIVHSSLSMAVGGTAMTLIGVGLLYMTLRK